MVRLLLLHRRFHLLIPLPRWLIGDPFGIMACSPSEHRAIKYRIKNFAKAKEACKAMLVFAPAALPSRPYYVRSAITPMLRTIHSRHIRVDNENILFDLQDFDSLATVWSAAK